MWLHSAAGNTPVRNFSKPTFRSRRRARTPHDGGRAGGRSSANSLGEWTFPEQVAVVSRECKRRRGSTRSENFFREFLRRPIFGPPGGPTVHGPSFNSTAIPLASTESLLLAYDSAFADVGFPPEGGRLTSAKCLAADIEAALSQHPLSVRSRCTTSHQLCPKAADRPCCSHASSRQSGRATCTPQRAPSKIVDG